MVEQTESDGKRVKAFANKAFIGRPAPEFVAEAVSKRKFKQISIKDYRGKYLVLIFYPSDFNTVDVSRSELCEFSNNIDQFNLLNCSIVAISTDSKYTHHAWLSSEQSFISGLKFPLCADKSHNISRDYGVLKNNSGVSNRALFIIDDNGLIRHLSINDVGAARSVEETLRLVTRFQEADEYTNP
uniref:thioredoxin-dependent peroxiredoxin n=1 Tax=Syphacia muris TaxID=451379 RepID=A0A0N5AR28_9BILA